MPDKERESTLNDQDKIADEIGLVAGARDTEFAGKVAEFIKARLGSLSDGHIKKGVITGFRFGDSTKANEVNVGLIGPQTEVKRTMMMEGFHVDDETFYLMLIGQVRRLKQSPQYAGRTNRDLMPTAIYATVTEYFGNSLTSQDAEARNRSFYEQRSQMSEEPQPDISISELKSKRMATCAEKAAVAQNLLTFSGMKSFFLAGQLTEGDKPTESGHAFNVIQTSKGYFIFEVTNPILYYGKDGMLEAANAAIYPISQEQFGNIIAGKPIEITHRDFRAQDDGSYQPVESKRTYSG